MKNDNTEDKALNKTDVSSSYNIKPTDFDAMICLFEQLNITYEVLKGLNKVRDVEYNTKIRIDQGLGYMDFYTEFYFMNGEIVNHAVWE